MAFVVFIMVAAVKCTRPTVVRFDAPMTREDVLKKGITFPIPTAAGNIQIARYSFGFAYELLVRFEAPVSVCEQHVAEVLKWHDKSMPKHMTKQEAPPVEKVDHVDYAENFMLKTTPWFDPGSLKRGLHVGRPGCSVPEMWIDQEKGIFYFRETD